MTIRRFAVERLQPTTALNLTTIIYLSSLSNSKLREKGRPQVLDTDEGLIISDGNNRSADWARRGERFISVEYINAKGVEIYYCELLNVVIICARNMRSSGV